MNIYNTSILFILYLCVYFTKAQSDTFIVPADRVFVPVSQVQFTIDLPDGNSTDAQLLEFECTERLNNGYITVNDTTYYIECVKPVMRVPITELGRIPSKVELHANVATLAPDSDQYRVAQEYARNQAKAKPSDQITTNPGGRKLMGYESLIPGYGQYGMYADVEQLKEDVAFAQRTAEKAMTLGFSNSARLGAHDKDIAMLATILTGSTCTQPECLGTGGVVGQLARNNLTDTYLLDTAANLLARANSTEISLKLTANTLRTLEESLQKLRISSANATQDLANQINANLASLSTETGTQIQAVYSALNKTQSLIDAIRSGADGDFEYLYSQVIELQDSAINSYSTMNSLITHKALRDIITQVFFDDLSNLDPTLIPLIKDGGISPTVTFSGPDLRITMESIDLCFMIASVSTPGGNRIVCQSYNIHSNIYYAIDSMKYSVNYKHLLSSMGPISCIRPYVDTNSPVDFDTTIDPSLNTSIPCQFYAEVVEKSCELSPAVTDFDFRFQNLSLGTQEQTTNIATICNRYSSPVITTGSTQGTVLRTSTEFSDFVKTRTCLKNLTLPYYYTRFYQTGTTMIIPQHISSCDVSLSQMERTAMKKEGIPLFIAIGTGWKLGYVQSQKLVSTLSLKLRGRMPGGVSNTDINYMPWTPTRLDQSGNPILDGGADAAEQWTIYWLAVSPDTIPVYAAQSIGSDSVSSSARIAIVNSATCNPQDPTCYSKELRLSVRDVVLDAATYSQFPELPYVYMGDIETSQITGMYDAPSNLISAGFDPSIQVNKLTCLLMPPGTNRTLDIQYFWDVKGSLYDPKTCGIDPSQFRYDAFVTKDGFPYCNINGGSPVDYEDRLYPLTCASGFNYNASVDIKMYQQGECSTSSLCTANRGCLSMRQLVASKMISNTSSAVVNLESSVENESFRANSFVGEFWLSYTNNTRPTSRYSIFYVNGDNGNFMYLENSEGQLILAFRGVSTGVDFGNFFPNTMLDVPVHFVLQVHGPTVQLFVNGALRFKRDYPEFATIDNVWKSVSIGGGTQTLTNTFLYGVRLHRYNTLLTDAWFLYQCGPFSAKGSGCNYDPSTPGAKSIVAEHDFSATCVLPTSYSEFRVFNHPSAPLHNNPSSLRNFDTTNLTTSTTTEMMLSFIDMRNIIEYQPTMNIVSFNIVLNNTNSHVNLSLSNNAWVFNIYHRGILTRCRYDAPLDILTYLKNTLRLGFSSTSFLINTKFQASGAVCPRFFSVNGKRLAEFPWVTYIPTTIPPVQNEIPSFITKISYFYKPNLLISSTTILAESSAITQFIDCTFKSLTHLPSAYANDINTIFSADRIWQPPFGQCIMSPDIPGFGYCRTPAMCGGRCQAWSIINNATKAFIPLSHVCDNGYTPPDCVRPCSRFDSSDGYCIDQYFRATSKNGFAPTSSHCSTARTVGMTTLQTNRGKFLVATPYEWRQTFKVVIPSGRINVKTPNSVCPTLTNAYQRADGKVSVALTNSDNKATTVVVSWYPFNPLDALNAPPECINVDGNTISIKANTVNYFYLPGNGCGNLTIVVSKANGVSGNLECSKVSTEDISLIVNQKDVTADFSPVITRIEGTQVNIIGGLQSAIEDLTKSLIGAFTNMISLVDNSNQVKNYSSVLLDSINNRPKTTYNPNVTVTTNFSDPESDAKFRALMEALDKERENLERLRNKSTEDAVKYITDMNNVNVTKFLLNLVGDSIFKGFNSSFELYPTGFDPRNPYPDKCGSKSSSSNTPTFTVSRYKQKQSRQLLGLGLPSVGLPSGVDIPAIGDAFDGFSQLMCGVTVAAAAAGKAAVDGANAAIEKAEDAADKGLDVISNGLGSPLDFLSKALGALVYIIPAVIIGFIVFQVYQCYRGGDCCRRADRNRDTYGKRSRKVAQSPPASVMSVATKAVNAETKNLITRNAKVPDTNFNFDM